MPPSARIPIDPIEGLHLRRVRLVSSLAFFIVGLGVGVGVARERTAGCDCGGRAGTQRAKELTTTQRPAALSVHLGHLPRSSALPQVGPAPLASSLSPRP